MVNKSPRKLFEKFTRTKPFCIPAAKSYLGCIRLFPKQSAPKFWWLALLCALLTPTVVASARTVPDPADATGFFTAVADKLLRSTFNFGITSIPVQTNGIFCYTPAVQRLLQVAANVRDAATTNFYPTVFRPVFFNDGQGNIFITGYQQVVSVSGLSDPQLAAPLDLTALPVGSSTNNIYGVPWIIGAKKFLPNFNEFYSFNTMQVSRRLQFNRPTMALSWAGASKNLYSTNQMLVMSITNHIGFSFWNSYGTNYPGGALTVCARDIIKMRLSYGSYIYDPAPYNFTPFVQSLTVWPGSSWNTAQLPSQQSANVNSFVAGNFDFPFVHEAAIDLDNTGNVVNSGFTTEVFNTNVTSLPPFPNFELDITNRFQAFILDGSNIVDYVQFYGPQQVRNLGDDLKDPNYVPGNLSSWMWSTNLSGSGQTGVNWGVQNQIRVSQTAQNIPPGKWTSPPNMPTGLNGIIAAEAAMFGGFFTPIWAYAGKSYTNTNLVMQAPFTPTRTVVSPTLWVVNDPLVHYLSSDLLQPLTAAYAVTNGVARSDDSSVLPIAFPNLASLPDRFQSWGRNAMMNNLVGVLHDDTDNASYNLSYRDPLVWTPDDWNFPATNTLPLITLGRIHRGTPWQTIFLKATNILNYTDVTQFNPAVGLATWEYWTGDFDATDAALLSPTSDWRLAALLAEMFNPNDATQLASVNTTNWLALLDGLATLTNSTATPYYNVTPQLDAFAMISNSPQAAFVSAALTQARANRPGQKYFSVGDILIAPEISELSPWLNSADPTQIAYGISDDAYEMIPAQLLPRFRPDSVGVLGFTNGGWRAQFSGSDAFDYALQTSTNLVNWNIVSTNQPAQGNFSAPIAPMPGAQKQFFRSVLLP